MEPGYTHMMRNPIIKIMKANEGTFVILVYSDTEVLRGPVVCGDKDQMLDAIDDLYEDEYPNPGFKEN